MKKLKTSVILAALFLSGCAAPPPPMPTTTADVSNPDPSTRKAALDAQARGLRGKITERKQKITVFEVMLTDVERRAARAQIDLSYLPNTNIESEVATQRTDTDRLSVAVRPSPVAATAAKPSTAKASVKKRPVRKQPVKKKKYGGNDLSIPATLVGRRPEDLNRRPWATPATAPDWLHKKKAPGS